MAELCLALVGGKLFQSGPGTKVAGELPPKPDEARLNFFAYQARRRSRTFTQTFHNHPNISQILTICCSSISQANTLHIHNKNNILNNNSPTRQVNKKITSQSNSSLNMGKKKSKTNKKSNSAAKRASKARSAEKKKRSLMEKEKMDAVEPEVQDEDDETKANFTLPTADNTSTTELEDETASLIISPPRTNNSTKRQSNNITLSPTKPSSNNNSLPEPTLLTTRLPATEQEGLARSSKKNKSAVADTDVNPDDESFQLSKTEENNLADNPAEWSPMRDSVSNASSSSSRQTTNSVVGQSSYARRLKARHAEAHRRANLNTSSSESLNSSESEGSNSSAVSAPTVGTDSSSIVTPAKSENDAQFHTPSKFQGMTEPGVQSPSGLQTPSSIESTLLPDRMFGTPKATTQDEWTDEIFSRDEVAEKDADKRWKRGHGGSYHYTGKTGGPGQPTLAEVQRWSQRCAYTEAEWAEVEIHGIDGAAVLADKKRQGSNNGSNDEASFPPMVSISKEAAEKQRVEMEKAEKERQEAKKRAEKEKSNKESKWAGRIMSITIHPDDMESIRTAKTWVTDAIMGAYTKMETANDFKRKQSMGEGVVNLTIDPPTLFTLLRNINPTHVIANHNFADDILLPCPSGTTKTQFHAKKFTFRILLQLTDNMGYKASQNLPASAHWTKMFVDVSKVEGTYVTSVHAYISDTANYGMNDRATKVVRKRIQQLLEMRFPHAVFEPGESGEQMPMAVLRTPQQINGDDCGVLTLAGQSEIIKVDFNPDESLIGKKVRYEKAMADVKGGTSHRHRAHIAKAIDIAMALRTGYYDETEKEMEKDIWKRHVPPMDAFDEQKRANEEARRLAEAEESKEIQQDFINHEEDEIPESFKMAAMPEKPADEADVPVYVALLLPDRPEEFEEPEDNREDAWATTIDLLQTLDPSSAFLALYSNSTAKPIRSSRDIPSNSIGRATYMSVQNGNSLVRQHGRDQYGKKIEQKNIYGTLLLQSSLDPEFLCNSVNGDLGRHGISLRVKRVQDISSSTTCALIGVHYSHCTAGASEALVHVIEATERNMIRTSGENKRYEDIPLPPIVLTTRVLRDPHTGNNTGKLELKRNMQHLKTALHLEMSTEDTKRINKVLIKADTSGILTRAFGPHATLLWANNNFKPKSVKDLQDELTMIKIQASLNLGHTTVTLHGITVISLPFKVALANGTTPKKSTMTLAKVIMLITAPDTEQNLTRHSVFSQVLPVSKGPEKGTARATYHDDTKSRTFRGKPRTKDGPNTGLVRNMAEYPVDYLFCFMRHELGYTEGTCYSALQGCNQELVSSVDLAEWNSETFRVSSPLRGESTVDSYIARSLGRFQELGMDDFDFSGLTESKQEVDDEDAEKEKLMRDHKLYPDLDNLPKVGASGATARTDASAVSSVAPSAKSTASINIEGAYRKAKMKLANKTVEAANQKSELSAQVEEEKARVATLLKMMQDAGIDTAAVMAGASAVGDIKKTLPKTKKTAFFAEAESSGGASQAESAVEIGSSSTSSIGSDADMQCDERPDESDDESSGGQSGVPPSGGSQTGGPQD